MLGLSLMPVWSSGKQESLRDVPASAMVSGHLAHSPPCKDFGGQLHLESICRRWLSMCLDDLVPISDRGNDSFAIQALDQHVSQPVIGTLRPESASLPALSR